MPHPLKTGRSEVRWSRRFRTSTVAGVIVHAGHELRIREGELPARRIRAPFVRSRMSFRPDCRRSDSSRRGGAGDCGRRPCIRTGVRRGARACRWASSGAAALWTPRAALDAEGEIGGNHIVREAGKARSSAFQSVVVRILRPVIRHPCVVADIMNFAPQNPGASGRATPSSAISPRRRKVVVERRVDRNHGAQFVVGIVINDLQHHLPFSYPAGASSAATSARQDRPATMARASKRRRGAGIAARKQWEE